MAIPTDDFIDISSEAVRRYIYPTGAMYTIKSPQLILVRNSSSGGHSHRIVSEHEGRRKSHYVAPGWIAIEWEKHSPDLPDFNF